MTNQAATFVPITPPAAAKFTFPLRVSQKLWRHLDGTGNPDRAIKDLMAPVQHALAGQPLTVPCATRANVKFGKTTERIRILRDPLEGVTLALGTETVGFTPASKAIGREMVIRLELIDANPNQPRKLFETEGIEELASSIKQHGLLQPLVVREREGRFELIAGERRWRAAQVAKMVALPCRVLSGVDDEQAFVLSVSENVARRDMTMIEEAKAFAHVEALGRSRQEVADLFGKSVEYVGWRMDLLRLRDDLQELAARGQLSKNMAWYVSRLTGEGQAQVMRRYLAGEFVNEDTACRYATAVWEFEQQPSLLGDDEDVDEFTAAARATRRTAMQVAYDRVANLSKTLGTFLEMDAAQIAEALGPDTSLYADRLDLLNRQTAKVAALLSKAAAIHSARVEMGAGR